MAFEWFEFGAELSTPGPPPLVVAERAARAVATGGGRFTSHEEDAIAAWFAGVVAEGISRSGSFKPDDLDGEHNAFAGDGFTASGTEIVRAYANELLEIGNLLETVPRAETCSGINHCHGATEEIPSRLAAP